MYPFKNGMTYPRNQWYVGAWSSEVTRELFERTLLDERVVLYRTEAGEPVALAGRCAHRRFPLVHGKLIGDTIECGYHGWTFNGSGACVRIPSQDTVPATLRGIASFPLVEKWQLLWIWMGDPALADPGLIPDHHLMGLDHPDWYALPGGTAHLKARFQLLNENILDLTHLTYTHAKSIGTGAVVGSALTFEDYPTHIHSERSVKNEIATPFHEKFLGLRGRINRDLISDFFPPSAHASGALWYSAEPTADGGPAAAAQFKALHFGTPETANSTHYFWAFTRTFAHGDAGVTASMMGTLQQAMQEDKETLEVQELAVDFGPAMVDASGTADAAQIRGRRRVEALIEAERRLVAPGLGGRAPVAAG